MLIILITELKYDDEYSLLMCFDMHKNSYIKANGENWL